MKGNNNKRYNIFLLSIITITANLLTTLLLILLKKTGFTVDNILVIYIVSVLITSLLTRGYVYGILASILSIMSFSFLFAVPIYSLKVANSQHIITFFVMLFASVITSMQTNKLIRSKELSDKHEKQSRILYQITSDLAKPSEIQEAFTVAAHHLMNLFDCDVSCIVMGVRNNTSVRLSAGKESNKVTSGNIDVNNINDVLARYYSIPVRYQEKTAGFLCLPKEMEQLEEERRFLLDSIMIQITKAVERILLIREKETARIAAERERYKSNLLRSISHDLRTPLTRISGAAEMIRHKENMKDSLKLADEIQEESSWLMRLVENILYLTRIQEDRMEVHMQKEAVEEIVAGAVARSQKYFPGRTITINVPEEVLFVPMDGKLIEQVLINLINNAIEHSSPTDEIKVQVYPEEELVWFEISDHGSGITEEDLPRIFDSFYISNRTRMDGIRGMGLGLAICKEIVNHHGGTISVKNNQEGGATFRFCLSR